MKRIGNFLKKKSGNIIVALVIIGLIALNILNYNGRLEAEKNYSDAMESNKHSQEVMGLEIIKYKNFYTKYYNDYWELLRLYQDAITPKLVK